MTSTRRGSPCAALALLALAGCVGDPYVTLPASRNTLKARTIVIDPYAPVAPPFATVRPLSGLEGAPLALHPELPDLRVPYGRRAAGAPASELDGAHVERVSVGGAPLCALTLDGLFPRPDAAHGAPASYAFAALDAHIESVLALGSARPSWRPERAAPAGPCPRNAALDAPATLAAVVANTALHLTAGTSWDPDGHTWPVDLVELPLALVTAAAPDDTDAAPPLDSLDAAFAAWVALARAVRARLPSTYDPRVALGGPDLTATDDDLPALAPDAPAPAPLAAFIAYCAAQSCPLDTLIYRTVTARAFGVRRITTALRARLDAAGLTATGLYLAGLLPALSPPWPDAPDLVAARLGAFETAARLFLQDTSVTTVVSGRGPFSFADGSPHTDTPLDDLGALLIPSAYFDLDGRPNPAFMARFPLRQIALQPRVTVLSGPDEADMAVLASRPDAALGALRVIIANADLHSGAGSLTWELRVPAFVPPAVRRVAFRLAVIDQKNHGLPSFFFSELGELTPDPRTGDVVLSRELPIPGVHYLELERPSTP